MDSAWVGRDERKFPAFVSSKSSFPFCEEKPFPRHGRGLADALSGFSAVLQDFWLQLGPVSCCRCLLPTKSSPESPSSFYRRGWWREWRGKEEEGLEEDDGEQGDMEAREAVAAASSASSSSPPPWSSWLTLDCKAAGVSHSLGRQLWRNGTQELK